MTAPIFQNLLPCRTCDATLSDFMRLPVYREHPIAWLIVAYVYEGGKKISIWLPGFQADADKPDYTVREQGYEYLQLLNKEVK